MQRIWKNENAQIRKYRDCREIKNRNKAPEIIKFSAWQMTMQIPRAVYVCLNLKDAAVPQEIAGQSICIQGDIGEVLKSL